MVGGGGGGGGLSLDTFLGPKLSSNIIINMTGLWGDKEKKIEGQGNNFPPPPRMVPCLPTTITSNRMAIFESYCKLLIMHHSFGVIKVNVFETVREKPDA